MVNEFIIIRGAKEHNLKNLNLDLPRNKLIVVTGLSGSGKSTLAFDTIYAEGQRRFVESLSSYARQFLQQLQKPDVEFISGLSPAIAIEQRSAGSSPRSTVATQTEIYDYLRLLFARVGKVYCYKCAKPVFRQSSQEIIESIMRLPEASSIKILAPIIKGQKGEHKEILSGIIKSGFSRCRIDNEIYEFPIKIKLAKFKIHNIDVLVDRLLIDPKIKKRLTDSVETALKIGKGTVIVSAQTNERLNQQNDLVFNEKYACSDCGISYAQLEPRNFSFNSPYGACSECNGLGTKLEFDLDLILPDKSKSINEGAIAAWKRGGKGYILYYRWLLRELARRMRFSLDDPFNKLSKAQQKTVLFGYDEIIGNKPFEGVIPHLGRLFRETDSDYLKEEINKFMSTLPCPACFGLRLKKESLAVRVGGKNICQITQLSIKDSLRFFTELKLDNRDKNIAAEVLKEISRKLKFCSDVGLDYLTLDRKSSTLSGGEAQRIRLATQVGSGLVGVLYVLDEPSIGLHQRDNQKLLSTLKALRDLGNTLIVVEHDEATILAADYIVDLGPGAGRHGGELIFSGNIKELLNNKDSLTAKYLRRELTIGKTRGRFGSFSCGIIPEKLPKRPLVFKKFIEVIGAREHNLKNIDVKFPLGTFISVTGVSGSGKSTLVSDILYKAVAQKLYKSKDKPGIHSKITGVDKIEQVIVVDQSPIGRTPRSNPATYTGVFSHIRDLFSQTLEAKKAGYKPGRFSFNVKGGRCEACSGDGTKKIEMHFLPDVYVKCDICKGERFNEATLAVKYKGNSIARVLDMTVEEALELFSNIPKIKNILGYLFDVGLGYIQLGQAATTLSGGEAQRIKLSSELSSRASGKALYILDEPTTGLHFADVAKLIGVLEKLVERGNTVVVIEHNLEVIKCADFIIDLGPEGGELGGNLVAACSPLELIKIKNSYTADALRELLKK